MSYGCAGYGAAPYARGLFAFVARVLMVFRRRRFANRRL